MFRELSNNESVIVDRHFEGTDPQIIYAFMMGYEFEARINDEPIYSVFLRRKITKLNNETQLAEDASLEEFIGALKSQTTTSENTTEEPPNDLTSYDVFFGDESKLTTSQRTQRLKFHNSSRYRRVRFQWVLDEGDIKNIDDLDEIARHLKHYKDEYCDGSDKVGQWRKVTPEMTYQIYFGDRSALLGRDKLTRDEFFKKPSVRENTLKSFGLPSETNDEEFKAYLINRIGVLSEGRGQL